MADAGEQPAEQPGDEDVAAYVLRQRRLLQLERDAEVAELAAAAASSEALATLEAAGTAVARLSLVGRRSSAGGRVTVELETRGGRVISAARLSTGDIVTVRAHFLPKAGKGAGKGSRKATGTQEGEDGVLSVLTETRIEVVLDEEAGDDAGGAGGAGDPGCMFAVIQIGSDVTYKRSLHALGELERAMDAPTHPSHTLAQVLFRGADAHFAAADKLVLTDEQRSFVHALNDSQQEAVELALRAKTLCVIHGPPGSGKSTTLVAYIAAEVLRGSRVLVVAPSNIACDGVAEKLAAVTSRSAVKFVRAGHPARVLESVAPHTLEARLAQTDEAELARDIRNELSALDSRVKDARAGERRGIRFEQRQLRKELRKRENDALKRLLARVDCVLATTTGAGGRMLRHATATDAFDVVVLDEAGQAHEVSALVALLRGKKAVLAGDPHQLAPTVKCQTAAKDGLGKTLLDRVFANSRLHQQTTRMLTVQYRMNAVISNWSSAALYGGRLAPAPSVANHLLSDFAPSVSAATGATPTDDDDEDDLTRFPWVLIDTAGCNFAESGEVGDSSKSGADRSKSNEGEASIIVTQVRSLLARGITAKQIGVISPYSGQVSLLRAKLRSVAPVEVATVDSFQGREKEAILISLVRSNERAVVGFLSDQRRLNVAITRARRLVVIVLDSSTCSSDPFIEAMCEYASEHGDYRCADPDMRIFVPPSAPTVADDSPQKEKAKGKGPAKKDRKKGHAGEKRRVSCKSKSASDGARSAEDDRKRKDVEDRVRAFATASGSVGAKQTFDFPASLTSYERLAVHSIAEQLGLSSKSYGEGQSRFISVSTGQQALSPPAMTEDAASESQPVLDADHHTEGNKFELLSPVEQGPTGNDSRSEITQEHDDKTTLPGVANDSEGSVQDSRLAKERGADGASTGPTSAADFPAATGTNNLLRDAALARQKRREQDADTRTPETPARSSSHRRIVDGVLLEGSRAKDAAATAAARSRLSSKLAKQSESRRRQQPGSK